jgi:hypothetical protein
MPGGAVNIAFGELGRQGEFEKFPCVFLAPDHHGKKIFHKKPGILYLRVKNYFKNNRQFTLSGTVLKLPRSPP